VKNQNFTCASMAVFIKDNPINNKPNPKENRKCIYMFSDFKEEE
jgi:hypothetical protein